ncbi:MAG: hypothetical protein PHS17_18910 [Desulfobacterales bacterium]|nr:hypothetical protein [Desulfobacterales bacterium]
MLKLQQKILIGAGSSKLLNRFNKLFLGHIHLSCIRNSLLPPALPEFQGKSPTSIYINLRHPVLTPLSNFNGEYRMRSIVFKTESASFTFPTPEVIKCLDHYISKFNVQEAREILSLINSSTEQVIKVPWRAQKHRAKRIAHGDRGQEKPRGVGRPSSAKAMEGRPLAGMRDALGQKLRSSEVEKVRIIRSQRSEVRKKGSGQ